MTEPLEFGPALTRLLARRALTVAELAGTAGVPAARVTAVLEGAGPSDALVRRLAPALGLRTADLFVLAGVRVPLDLKPLESRAGRRVHWIVRDLLGLPADERAGLLELVRSLPQEERTTAPERPTGEPRGKGAGAKVVRMALNRNLDLFGLAYTMAYLTPSYLSPSTYGLIGRAEEELTPDLAADFATLLGMDPGDLSALTGIALSGPLPPPGPEVTDAVALIWSARRLSDAQLAGVAETVDAVGAKLRDGVARG
ncbi:hypothetical protein [Kitasatospora cheerisanensis]|uniref:Uncharacterized protein n=1 Tax=Kitasatospora cheerisanensis KCTC 2395 TaxID=1348663 RepID=A0A066ZBC3_9ACTN|nr:hypothetical protein [Kitasatospora cheerisanensis]KDN87606.1 hypothetical protein KCH_06190 [Kitasatospora cheerisanensis KCTC 2395]